MYDRLHKSLLVLLLSLALLPIHALAQADEKPSQELLEKVITLHKENLKTYANNENMLVLPGLLADKKNQRVEVYIQITDSAGTGDVEFFVVGHESSHGYEALSWSFARPSAIHEALQFIGMKPGLPVDYRKLRFVAKGERVEASIRPLGNAEEMIRLEECMKDVRTEKPPVERGFIYTGSMMVPPSQDATNLVMAADFYDPYSIIPMFNDPFAVMDVPWTMSQGEVFENLVSAGHGLKPKTLMVLVLEPQQKDGQGGPLELVLHIDAEKGFMLQDSKGKTLNKEPVLEQVINTLADSLEKGFTPHLRPDFDPMLKLSSIRDVSGIIDLLKVQTAVMIEPPEEGQLYYKAFMPDDAGRKVEDRITQPWELHFSSTNKQDAATLVIHQETWIAGKLDPELTKLEWKVSNGNEIKKQIETYLDELKKSDKRIPPAVILVYAPRDMLYKDVLDWLKPVLPTHKTVYIYLDEKSDDKS
jgi:hypothetical protein